MIWTILGLVEVRSGQILSFCKSYHNCLSHTVDWVIWWIAIMPIKWNYKLELCSRFLTQWMYNHAPWYAFYRYSLINISSRGMTRNTRKSISYQITAATHFRPFSAIFCHCLPGYRIVHNKKRAETHGCQFRPMLTWLPL